MFSVAAASTAGIGPEAGSDDIWGLQLDASALAAAVESKGISADKPVVVSVSERLATGRNMQWSARGSARTSPWW